MARVIFEYEYRLLKENESLRKANASLEVALAGDKSVGVVVGDDPGTTWTASQGMTSGSDAMPST